MILVSKRMGKKVWVAIRQERMTECEIEKLRRSQIISGFDMLPFMSRKFTLEAVENGYKKGKGRRQGRRLF